MLYHISWSNVNVFTIRLIVKLYIRPNKKICEFAVTGKKNLGFWGVFLLSAKPEIVVPGSGIRFRYFIFEISGKPSFVEAVFINYDELRSFSSFFALNYDKKLAVE